MIAGDGVDRENIVKKIEEYNLEDQIILLGNLSNPYAYMKKCDLLMNVSYHEAAPMVFLEAKALNTPVFATETLSAREMIKDEVEGFICENSLDGIRNKFAYLVQNKELVKSMKENNQFNLETLNEEMIDKIKLWIE